MPHFSIYGKLVFKDTPNPDELLTLAYRLVSKSIEYRFERPCQLIQKLH